MISRWGAPAPSGPPMAVPERIADAVNEGQAKLYAIISADKQTASTLRDQLQARAEELRKDISALSDKQAELALIERMLEVK